MLVLSMNSKRQRRPNVRLGEIGDVPAAFACGFSQKTKENLGLNSYENDVLNPNNTAHSDLYGFTMQTSPEFVVLGPGVSPRIPADLQQNRENKNPNSSKSAFELVNSDEIDMTKLKLNFGTITRKCRVMKRRGRGIKGTSNVFGSIWSSKLKPQFSNEDSKECSVKDFVRFTSDECNEYYPDNGFKDLSDHETPATSKEAYEFDMDGPAYDTRQHRNPNEFWQGDTSNEGNNASPASNNTWDEMKSGGCDVNTVTRWLEDQGFGKYAGVFEMHEVDEEALPLLTLEDLKEIGVFAVGPRRKLYTAIQQLRKGGISTCQNIQMKM
ncbi:hypothetical protein P3X46_023144 [Hevea brasiliensis]|uniref:Uncharacterized protein n=2 Tax=Hevea brasiliensis TaxID=3981 RepID=A0A6A6MGR6_HEVBR|nr:uncharacterized protein LOC110660748 [Hevea brasiliensis]KAF2312902.1 hypothetical protein GH714_040962 [Hevea brasiliensis]KAJ9163482.1 hypothetical protein P3X46_023144 [Hevea brasiliensis]